MLLFSEVIWENGQRHAFESLFFPSQGFAAFGLSKRFPKRACGMSTKQPQRASGRTTRPVRLRPRRPSRAFLLFTAAALAATTFLVGSPCPACVIEGSGNCQLIEAETAVGAVPSDLSAPGGPMVRADDFVPTSDSISKVCVWGMYFDTTDPEGDGSAGCVQAVHDDFRVTVYADAGGIPGDVIGWSTVSSPARTISGETPQCGTWGEVYSYQLELDDPIVGMTPGECHWLEVTNDTASPEDVEPNRCVWQWSNAPTSGNNYSFAGSHDGAFGVYEDGGQRSSDLAFCLDTDFEPGGCGQLQRACCTCPDDGGTCTIGTFADCSNLKGQWLLDAPECVGAPCPLEAPQGDDCETDAIPITGDVSINLSTSCSTTDGPKNPLIKLGTIGSDIWFAYRTSCTGQLVASMCATDVEYDSMIGVFFDPTNPTECACPGPSSATLSGRYSDEGCDGCGTGGAGYLFRDVFPGECWLIRVAGFDGDQGVGRLDVSCEERFCPESSPALHEIILDSHGNPVIIAKNRFLSFSAGDADQNQAVRVTFVDLPPPYDSWNGNQLWVGEPKTTSIPRGHIDPPTAIFDVSMLRCGDPIYVDWNQFDVVHAFHEGIVPSGTYRIDVIDEECLVTDDSFSDPLEIVTAKWGDSMGICEAYPCTPPNGDVSIYDVLALINRFVGFPFAISLIRADLEPRCIDLRINITDVLHAVNAFNGLPYPFEPTAADPCQSTCVSPVP